MNRHQEFLQTLFRFLEERRVPYCLQRNYDEFYAQDNLDIDFLCESETLSRFNECVQDAVEAASYRLVLRSRYINYSQVFQHPEGGFARLDVETEIRWRVFPLLSAKAVIGLRRRRDDFYVPHPRHESVILFAAGIWRGILSERYCKRLAALYEQLNDAEQLRRTFRAVFGHAGNTLADCQFGIAAKPPSRQLLKEARLSIIGNALRHRPNCRAFYGYLLADTRRLVQRVRQPPGISLLYCSSARPARDVPEGLKPFEFLFPAEKSVRWSDGATAPSNPEWRPGLSLRLQRAHTLFRGGLFVDCHRVKNDAELSRPVSRQTRLSYPDRAFVCLENSRSENTFAHLGTGFMEQTGLIADVHDRSHRLLSFIASILGREAQGIEAARGVFIVLLGLDGSGKTTVARHLSFLAGQRRHFRAVRYFHWRPGMGISLPVANPALVPRKPFLRPNPLRSFFSILRLFKNILLTRLAWSFHIEKLLREQTLLVLDRYYYNYFLDPISVRYYGPTGLLERMRQFYPRPDLVVILDAPEAVLLARKKELSSEEIHRQRGVLNQLNLEAKDKLVVDATRSPGEIAEEIWQRVIDLDHG